MNCARKCIYCLIRCKMNKFLLVNIVLFACLFGCNTSRDELVTRKFVTQARAMNIEEIQNLCSEDTKFYIKMTIEPILLLGDENSIRKLKEVASTLECQTNNNNGICFFLDENGREGSFKYKLKQKYNLKSGKIDLKIDIDKNFFISY